MTKIIGWGLAGVAAVAAAIYLATRGTKPAGPTDLCVAQLPAPFDKQAADVIKGGDAALMCSFAAQCDAKGWHCAAKELRFAASSAVPEPHRTDWANLIARARTEKGGQLVVDLKFAADAAKAGGYCTEKDLRDAILLVIPRVYLADVAEQPLHNDIRASFLHVGWDPSIGVGGMGGGSSGPGDEILTDTAPEVDSTSLGAVIDVTKLDDVAKRLAAGGYSEAANEARAAAKHYRDRMEAERTKKDLADRREAAAATCSDEIAKLPKLMPFKMTPMPGDLRKWVTDVVAEWQSTKGNSVAVDFLHKYLAALATEMESRVASGESFDPPASVYSDAGECLGRLLPVSFTPPPALPKFF